MRTATIVVCALVLSGCSFLFVHGPPDEHEKLRYFDCPSNAAGPVADVSWALFDGIMVAGLAGADRDEDDSGDRAQTTVLVVFAALGALHAASAIYGVAKATDCGDAKQHLRQRIDDREAETDRRIHELQTELDRRRGGGLEPPTGVEAVVVEPQPSATPSAQPASAPQPQTSDSASEAPPSVSPGQTEGAPSEGVPSEAPPSVPPQQTEGGTSEPPPSAAPGPGGPGPGPGVAGDAKR